MSLRLNIALLVIGPLGAAACSCGEPSIPPPPTTPPVETGDTSIDMTGDTAPPKECDAPEVEPNDTVLEPSILPTNVVGCGDFSFDGDFDNWRIVVDEPSWLTVQAYADDGSTSDVAIILSSAQTGIAAARDTDEENPGVVTLLFPAEPDTYALNVREEQNKSGERYTYEVIATVSKAPYFEDSDGGIIDWMPEQEPNDIFETEATPLRDGDAILGSSTMPFDIDWYRVSVAPGKHTLDFEIQAYRKGSAGNYRLSLFTEDQQLIDEAVANPGTSSYDPRLVYQSDGDETLYLQVREENNLGNPAIWYMLDTRVEASQ
jgi:hypothetical protein